MNSDYPINIVVAKQIVNDVVVINKGSIDNIEEWMRFLIYEESDEVIDPVSKESLGNLEKPKGYFTVQHIQEKMSVLVSELRRENNLFGNILKTDVSVERDILKTIKVGDKVKIVNIE